MKQRKLISLLGAGVIACTAVPMLPAAAAAEPVPDTSAAEQVRIHHVLEDFYFFSREVFGSGDESELELTRGEDCFSFSAGWQDVTADTETMFLAGRLTQQAVGFPELTVLDAHCTLQTDLTGQDAYFGWRTRFAETDGEATYMTDCYLADGFSTQRPALPDSAKIGTLTYNEAAYDIYLLDGEQLSESPAKSAEKWETVKEYWIVREAGIVPDEITGAYELNADLSELFRGLAADYDFEPGAWCESAFFLDVKAGSGTAVSPYIDICAPIRDGRTYTEADETGVTEDGYQWSQWALPPYRASEMTPGVNGAFSCAWSDVPVTLFEMGRGLESPVVCDAENPVRYDYVMTLGGFGTAFSGVSGKVQYYQIPENTAAADIGKYLAAFYVIDAWTGEQAPGSVLQELHPSTANEKIGEITADGAVYDVYREWCTQVSIDGFVPAPAFYSVRRDNLLTDPDEEFRNSVDIAAHLEGYRALGQQAGALYDAKVFVEAGNTEAWQKVLGNAEITGNVLDLEVKKAAQPLKQSVRGDANCDGIFDVSDAVLVARIVVEDTGAVISEQGLRNADADGAAGLNADDILCLLKALAKKIVL